MRVGGVDLMSDASEIVHYDDEGLSLYICRDTLSSYPGLRAAAHWHEDLEFIVIEKGKMNYSVNGKTILLSEGDVLFVNARQLHFGFDEQKQECQFLCVLIHPSLITGKSRLLDEMLEHMLQDTSFPCVLFSEHGQMTDRKAAPCEDEIRDQSGAISRISEQPETVIQTMVQRKEVGRIREQLETASRVKESNSYGYRLQAVGLLAEITGEILDIWFERKNMESSEERTKNNEPGLDLQRRMVAFVEENYAAELSLDHIAQSAAVSRSTCCRLFQKYAHTSPLVFLNSYRLQVARTMLLNTNLRVTEIAMRCGFNHASYFSALFRKNYGRAPGEFRRQHI